jgi:hypothetical protein
VVRASSWASGAPPVQFAVTFALEMEIWRVSNLGSTTPGVDPVTEIKALCELCSLYRSYLRMVVRSGLGTKLRERVELSDVVQKVLVDVVRQFPQFNGETEAAVMGWRRRVGQRLADLGRYHRWVNRWGGTRWPCSLMHLPRVVACPARRAGG